MKKNTDSGKKMNRTNTSSCFKKINPGNNTKNNTKNIKYSSQTHKNTKTNALLQQIGYGREYVIHGGSSQVNMPLNYNTNINQNNNNNNNSRDNSAPIKVQKIDNKIKKINNKERNVSSSIIKNNDPRNNIIRSVFTSQNGGKETTTLARRGHNLNVNFKRRSSGNDKINYDIDSTIIKDENKDTKINNYPNNGMQLMRINRGAANRPKIMHVDDRRNINSDRYVKIPDWDAENKKIWEAINNFSIKQNNLEQTIQTQNITISQLSKIITDLREKIINLTTGDENQEGSLLYKIKQYFEQNSKNYLTKAELERLGYAKKTDLNQYVKNETFLSTTGKIDENINNINMNIGIVDNKIKDRIQSLYQKFDNYYNRSDIDGKIATANNALAKEILDRQKDIKDIRDKHYDRNQIDLKFDDYYNKNDIKTNFATKTDLQIEAKEREENDKYITENYAPADSLRAEINERQEEIKVIKNNFAPKLYVNNVAKKARAKIISKLGPKIDNIRDIMRMEQPIAIPTSFERKSQVGSLHAIMYNYFASYMKMSLLEEQQYTDYAQIMQEIVDGLIQDVIIVKDPFEGASFFNTKEIPTLRTIVETFVKSCMCNSDKEAKIAVKRLLCEDLLSDKARNFMQKQKEANMEEEEMEEGENNVAKEEKGAEAQFGQACYMVNQMFDKFLQEKTFERLNREKEYKRDEQNDSMDSLSAGSKLKESFINIKPYQSNNNMMSNPFDETPELKTFRSYENKQINSNKKYYEYMTPIGSDMKYNNINNNYNNPSNEMIQFPPANSQMSGMNSNMDSNKFPDLNDNMNDFNDEFVDNDQLKMLKPNMYDNNNLIHNQNDSEDNNYIIENNNVNEYPAFPNNMLNNANCQNQSSENNNFENNAEENNEILINNNSNNINNKVRNSLISNQNQVSMLGDSNNNNNNNFTN